MILNLLALDVEIYPDADQDERAERFGVCQKTIWQTLKKLNVTYKKALMHPKVTVGKRRDFQRQIVGHRADKSLILMKMEYLPPYSPDLNPIERKWA